MTQTQIEELDLFGPPTGAERLDGRLRRMVIEELNGAGYVIEGAPRNERLSLDTKTEALGTKDQARRLHSKHRAQVLAKNAAFVGAWEERLLPKFADGDEVIVSKIKPSVRPVESDEDVALFRYASLAWSVPVSNGYGRRTRFLVMDESNDRLMGIFALGDPVFNLRVRDELIGWTSEDRKHRLYNVYDAYVLGAIEPYRQLIGGKLIAALAVSDEVAAMLTKKYEGKATTQLGIIKDPSPVLITTTSSLGRSSVYNRLTFEGRRLFSSVGFTEGFGHFHFSDELFEGIVEYLSSIGARTRGSEYGQGPNWRIRTLRAGLEALGFNGDLLRHGIRREVFLAPRAVGWRSYLRGETTALQWMDFPTERLSKYWLERWAIPRSERDASFSVHRRETLRISAQLAAGDS